MKKIWKPRVQKESAEALSQNQKGLPNFIQKILSHRQIEPELWDGFLNPKLQDLSDPMSMKGMKEAVERLVSAHRSQEKICLYADFDLDGTSGLALLWKGMQELGFLNLEGYQPQRLSEGYGFHASAVEELAKRGVKVIVTIDVGITAMEACARARELGIDVILTDHHLPASNLPSVFALVNPNQKECQSGLGYLCGAGVAFYLLRALKRGLLEEGLIKSTDLDLKSLLDFLTIATLTDMVPLVRDNRALVRYGLVQLSQTKKPGLQVLLEKLDLYGKALTSQDVAIKFAPKLNALSRLETGLRPLDLYRAQERAAADAMVAEVLDQNANRVELQSSGETRALELLEGWEKGSDFYFVADSSFHRGVVGLIATKISQTKNRPAFVGSIGADGLIVGSARSPQGSGISVLEALHSAGAVLNRFGGHNGAAGFELSASRQSEMVSALREHFQNQAAQEMVVNIDYDLDLDVEDLSNGLMNWIDSMGPFGQGFPQPMFRIPRALIKESRVLRGGHLKLKIQSLVNSKTIDALYFSPPPKFDHEWSVGAHISLLGELQWNEFAGQRNLQFLIRDSKAADFAQAELLSSHPEVIL